MTPTITWVNMGTGFGGVGNLYPVYHRHTALIDEPLAGPAFNPNTMYTGIAVYPSAFGGYQQSLLSIQVVEPIQP